MSTAVIIVPGLNTPLWLKSFKFFVRLYYRYWGLDQANGNTWTGLKEYVEQNGFTVYIFEWKSAFSDANGAIPEGKRLAKFIDTTSEEKIILFGYSLGGVVAENAITYSTRKEKISKLLSVASPHKNKWINLPHSIKIVNIYSDADNYLTFANRMRHFKDCKTIKNADNIMIPHLTHSQFNKNLPIQTEKGVINLYDYYLEIIKQ